jgi:hypothetical protein
MSAALIAAGVQLFGVGASLANSSAQTEEQREINARVARELDKSLWALLPMRSELQTEYRTRQNILGVQEGRSLFDVTKSYNTSMARSGFEASGALQQDQEIARGSVYEKFGESRYDLEQQRQLGLNDLASQERTIRIQRASLDTTGETVWTKSQGAEAEDWLEGEGYPTPPGQMYDPETGGYIPIPEIEGKDETEAKWETRYDEEYKDRKGMWANFQRNMFQGISTFVDKYGQAKRAGTLDEFKQERAQRSAQYRQEQERKRREQIMQTRSGIW